MSQNSGSISGALPSPESGDRRESRSIFDIYKSGQGYHTRVWSGVVYGALVAWGAYSLYLKLDLVNNKWVQIFVPLIVFLGLAFLGYWLLAQNRRVCDFLIATEGEMKKVNWTSRKEIIGSTKVVIFVVVVMSVMLFVVDLLFMTFFSWIGVLKGANMIDVMRDSF